MSLNTETKKVKLMSVMRDTLVPITYNGKTTYAKINSAYNKGPEFAIKTLNTIFGLDISEYATVNFYGMSDIIEAVGGIDVELAKGELDVMSYENGKRVNYGLNGCISEICSYKGLDASKYYIREAGVHHLNGVQAVAYARIRHAANIDGVNDDFGRTDRQRYVMEQLFNKAIKLGKSQYVKLAKSLMPCSETSLSYSEILSLAVNILLQSPTFEQTRIPDFSYQMPSKSISGVGSCVYYDLNFASKLIHAFIYDDIKPEDYIEANGVEKNDWYTGSAVKKPSSNSSTVKNPSSSSSQNSSSASSDTITVPEPSSDTDSSSSLPSDGSNSSSEPSVPDNPDSSSDSSAVTPSEDSKPDESSSPDKTE